MSDLCSKSVWTLADVAAYFGESIATARRKIAARRRAGFPAARPKVTPHEPYKWSGADVMAWAERAGGQVPSPANDTGRPPVSATTPPRPLRGGGATGAVSGGPVDRSADRSDLLGRL